MAYAMELRRGEVIADDEKLESMKLVPLMYTSGADAAVVAGFGYCFLSCETQILPKNKQT